MLWAILHDGTQPDDLGYIPSFLDDTDPRGAVEQLDANYQHGGGWSAMKGHVLGRDNSLTYPGDPPLPPLAATTLRDELIVVYPYGFVAVIQQDRSFEVSRMD